MSVNPDIKLAVSIPIGSLKRFGYQYHWQDVLENASKCFDKVYLLTTTRENIDLQINFDNVCLIVDDRVLLDLDEDNNEVFNIYKIYNAYNLALSLAYQDGFDFVIASSINMYLDDTNSIKMRAYCKSLYQEGKPYGYFGKAFQFGAKICYPNTQLPFIANLAFKDKIVYDVDVLQYEKKRLGWLGGMLNVEFYFIDIHATETEMDFREKYDWYIKSYMKDWQNKDIGDFDFNKEMKKIERRVQQQSENTDYPTNSFTERIMKNYPENAVVSVIKLKFANYYYFYTKSMILFLAKKIGLLKFIGNR